MDFLELVKDLKDLRDRLDSIVETLEIIMDEDLVRSIEASKEQLKRRDFKEFLRELGIDPISMSD